MTAGLIGSLQLVPRVQMSNSPKQPEEVGLVAEVVRLGHAARMRPQMPLVQRGRKNDLPKRLEAIGLTDLVVQFGCAAELRRQMIAQHWLG